MKMNLVFIFLFYLPVIFSLNFEGLVSSVLDFVPGVGNVKSLAEAVTGKDIITGEELSRTERALSLLGAIPGGNFLKNGKHLKNGQKFLKAAQRAQKVGKIKNAINFGKASVRAMTKANKVQNTVKNFFKVTKAVLKQTGEEEKKREEINDDM